MTLEEKIKADLDLCEKATPNSKCSKCGGKGKYLDYYPLGDEEVSCDCGAEKFTSAARTGWPQA